ILRVVIFFFQAEDGIRDFHVTGVQTCALPILNTQIQQLENMITKKCKVLVIASIDGSALTEVLRKAAENGIKVIAYDRLIMNSRSEERRVGKECRSRWSPEQ